jgi:hypothetical protein
MNDVFIYSIGNDRHSPSLFISMNLTLNMCTSSFWFCWDAKKLLFRQDVKCYSPVLFLLSSLIFLFMFDHFSYSKYLFKYIIL